LSRAVDVSQHPVRWALQVNSIFFLFLSA